MEFIDLIPTALGGTLWKIVAFVVALSTIVFVHEYGHYIVGKWCGIKAEVFSLGFGPVLVSRRDRHGTLWQVAAFPLGGFVRFLGDSDAASSGVSATVFSPEQRRKTLFGAPLWARAATVAAGPAANFILAIIIFVAMSFFYGVPTQSTVISKVYNAPFSAPHLQQGDEILQISGQDVATMTDVERVVANLSASRTVDYLVRRDGSERSIEGPHPLLPLILSVVPQSAAYDAGLQVEDVILSVNKSPISTFSQLRDSVVQGQGAALLLEIWRQGDVFEATLTPRPMDLPKADGGFEQRWLLGVTGGMLFAPQSRTPHLTEAVTQAFNRIGFIVESSVLGIWEILRGGISTCNLQGPLGIAESSVAAANSGVDSFIFFIGVLSVAIGMMNLFPIPVLDGGHLLFYAYEAIIGRPPNGRALRLLMSIGFSFLIMLMIFSLSNDIFCP